MTQELKGTERPPNGTMVQCRASMPSRRSKQRTARWSTHPRLPHHTAEPQMTGAAFDRLAHPRRRPVAPRMVRRAKEGTALHHLVRRVESGCLDAAGLARRNRVARFIPVRGPFPDIADHVVKAVAIGREV